MHTVTMNGKKLKKNIKHSNTWHVTHVTLSVTFGNP